MPRVPVTCKLQNTVGLAPAALALFLAHPRAGTAGIPYQGWGQGPEHHLEQGAAGWAGKPSLSAAFPQPNNSSSLDNIICSPLFLLSSLL